MIDLLTNRGIWRNDHGALAVLVGLLLSPACSVDVNHGAREYSCADDGICPSGLECIEDICREPLQPSPDGAGVVIDAAPGTPDAALGAPDAAQSQSIAITASEEDAEELVATGVVDLLSTDLELAAVPAGAQIIGLRFSALDIGIGEAIVSAHIQFEADEASVDAAALVIRTEANGNPEDFSSDLSNLSGRTASDISVAWVPAPWPDVGASGADQATPDLSTLLSQRVNDPEWRRGNSMVFFITGSGTRVAKSFDGDPAGAAHLVIELE